MNNRDQSKFISSIQDLERANDEGDSELAMKCYSTMLLALGELRNGFDKGENFLVSALNYNDYSVVAWAALALLPSHEGLAIDALKTVIEHGNATESFSAEITLGEWQAGRLKTI